MENKNKSTPSIPQIIVNKWVFQTTWKIKYHAKNSITMGQKKPKKSTHALIIPILAAKIKHRKQANYDYDIRLTSLSILTLHCRIFYNTLLQYLHSIEVFQKKEGKIGQRDEKIF